MTSIRRSKMMMSVQNNVPSKLNNLPQFLCRDLHVRKIENGAPNAFTFQLIPNSHVLEITRPGGWCQNLQLDIIGPNNQSFLYTVGPSKTSKKQLIIFQVLEHNLPQTTINPGAITLSNGNIFLCLRNYTLTPYASNLYGAGYTDGVMEPPTLLVSHAEDPRLFYYQETLYISFSRTRLLNDTVVACEMLVRNTISNKEISLDLNLQSPRWEKNWIFFENGGELHMIYQFTPVFMLYKVDLDLATTTLKLQFKLNHQELEIRGGTNVVLVDGVYYMMAHTAVSYDVYAVKLDATYHNMWITPNPVISNFETKRIYYPSGLTFDSNTRTFTIFMGVNDKIIAYCRLSIDFVNSLFFS